MMPDDMMMKAAAAMAPKSVTKIGCRCGFYVECEVMEVALKLFQNHLAAKYHEDDEVE